MRARTKRNKNSNEKTDTLSLSVVLRDGPPVNGGGGWRGVGVERGKKKKESPQTREWSRRIARMCTYTRRVCISTRGNYRLRLRVISVTISVAHKNNNNKITSPDREWSSHCVREGLRNNAGKPCDRCRRQWRVWKDCLTGAIAEKSSPIVCPRNLIYL